MILSVRSPVASDVVREHASSSIYDPSGGGSEYSVPSLEKTAARLLLAWQAASAKARRSELVRNRFFNWFQLDLYLGLIGIGRKFLHIFFTLVFVDQVLQHVKPG